jgi:hypothetical protein
MTSQTAPHSTMIVPHSETNQARFAMNGPLAFTALASVGLLVVAVIGLLTDPRIITGVPGWIKPLKFAVSIGVYCLTLAWLLSFVQGHRRLVALIGHATALGLTIELVVIALQVIRGTTSHFNLSTPLDEFLWQLMGLAIIPVWLTSLLTALLLIFQRLPDSAFAWSLRLGVLVSFVGMGVAFLMVSQRTPAQQAALQMGNPTTTAGAHSVGVEDGGPGLPFLGWSTAGGDLRVPHFVGLHALQVLPLVGFLISRFGAGKLSARRRLALVWTVGLGYLGIVLLLTWQALRGQSVIAPDAATLAAFGGLAAAIVLVTTLIFGVKFRRG